MKKNANILEYVEKYKYKYGISYAVDGGKLVKSLSVLTGIVLVYSFVINVLSVLSFILHFYVGIFNYSDFDTVFITTIICMVSMVVVAIFFVRKNKIVACIIAIVTQPLLVFAYAPISRYGIGFYTGFYWKYLIPAILLILFAALLLFVLVRAKVKTNKLYDMIVEGLYKQYGTRDGEKLTEEEWNEFLTQYNPYKPLV